jgi:hypothetical protein
MSRILSGKMRVKMDDGTEIEGGPGDTAVIPLGHDAWVVGDKPFISNLLALMLFDFRELTFFLSLILNKQKNFIDRRNFKNTIFPPIDNREDYK